MIAFDLKNNETIDIVKIDDNTIRFNFYNENGEKYKSFQMNINDLISEINQQN